MSNLRTAILIDGSPDAPAIRIEEGEKKTYISQGRAGDKPRNFRFVRPVTLSVKGEDEPRTVYLYRLEGGNLADEEFEALAKAEADKHLNPEKYAKVTSKPLNVDERAELESYRKRFGQSK
jgi:hypothetical protein